MPLYAPPAPREVSLGKATLTYTSAVAVGAGARTLTATLAGVLPTDRLLLFPTSAMPDGFLVMAHGKASTGSFSAAVFHGPLAMNGTFSIEVDVYAIRA